MRLPAESLSTLKFASRAKNVRNLASVNEDVDQVTLLRKYEAELRRLRGELQQRQALVVDKRHLLQVWLPALLCPVRMVPGFKSLPVSWWQVGMTCVPSC